MALPQPFILSIAPELIAEILKRVKQPCDLLALAQTNSTLYEHAIPHLLRSVLYSDRRVLAGLCEGLASHANQGRHVRSFQFIDGKEPSAEIMEMLRELVPRLPRLELFALELQPTSNASFSSAAFWETLTTSCPSLSSMIMCDATVTSKNHSFYQLDPDGWNVFCNTLDWSSEPLGFYRRASNLQSLALTFPPWTGPNHSASEFWQLRFPRLKAVTFFLYGHLSSEERHALARPPPAGFNEFWIAHPTLKSITIPASITWTPSAGSLPQLSRVQGGTQLWLWAMQGGVAHRQLVSIVHRDESRGLRDQSLELLNKESPLFGRLLEGLLSLESSLRSLSIRGWPNKLRYAPTLYELTRVIGPYLQRFDLRADHLWGWLSEPAPEERQTLLTCLANMAVMEVLYITDWISSSGWTTPKHGPVRTALKDGSANMAEFHREASIGFTEWVRTLANRCPRLRKVRLIAIHYPDFFGTGVIEPYSHDLSAIIKRVPGEPRVEVEVMGVPHELHELDIDAE